jgi:hypothetical protein
MTNRRMLLNGAAALAGIALLTGAGRAAERR